MVGAVAVGVAPRQAAGGVEGQRLEPAGRRELAPGLLRRQGLAEAEVQHGDHDPVPARGDPAQHVGPAALHPLRHGGGVGEGGRRDPRAGDAGQPGEGAGAGGVGHHLELGPPAPLDLQAASPESGDGRGDLAALGLHRDRARPSGRLGRRRARGECDDGREAERRAGGPADHQRAPRSTRVLTATLPAMSSAETKTR